MTRFMDKPLLVRAKKDLLDEIAVYVLCDHDAPPYAVIAAWKHLYNDDSADLESIVREAIPSLLREPPVSFVR
jgi:hypothetical protein